MPFLPNNRLPLQALGNPGSATGGKLQNSGKKKLARGDGGRWVMVNPLQQPTRTGQSTQPKATRKHFKQLVRRVGDNSHFLHMIFHMREVARGGKRGHKHT